MPVTLIWRTLTALFLCSVIGWLPHASAQSPQPVPALTARLIDHSNTLTSAQAQAIEARLHNIETSTGAQVVVLMVPSTAPEDIAPFAHRVASDWKIGRKDVGDGVLIVIAPEDRRMRIEVARTLEGAIPDLVASQIIEQQMAPHFRQGDYAGGILAALDHIEARITGEALPAPPPRKTASPASGSSAPSFEDFGFFSLLGTVLVCAIVRKLLGRLRGGLLMAAIAAAITWWSTLSLLYALIAAIAAFLLTSSSGGGGRGGGSSGRGGHRSRSGSGSGGFRSGGGGSFGGGGASGRW